MLYLVISTHTSAEVLHYTGALDNIPALSEEQADIISAVKRRALQSTSVFRKQVTSRLNPASMQELFDKERMAALGVASGAIVGVML